MGIAAPHSDATPLEEPIQGEASLVALLVVMIAVVFSHVLECNFVSLDDSYYVTGNTPVQMGFTGHNIAWAFTDTNGMWAPLTWLSLMLDHNIWGLNPLGYHLTNLLFHVGSALLLYWFLRKATGSAWRALLATALFALHPLRVESVAWISERKDVLSVFFGLAGLVAYGAYGRKDKSHGESSIAGAHWKRGWLYGLTLLCLTLSLCSKPMLVTFPFLLLLLDIWPLGRLDLGPAVQVSAERGYAPSGLTESGSDLGSKESARRSLMRDVALLCVEKVPFLVLGIIVSYVTYGAQQLTGAMRDQSIYGFSTRLANAVVSYARYLGKMFWFRNLAALYPYPGHWPTVMVAGAAGLLVCITVLVIWRLRAQPQLAVGWFWFVGTLVPVIGIVQVGDQSMADRYTYFPAIGLCIMAAYAIPSHWVADAVGRQRVKLGAVVVLIVLGCASFIQVSYWKNSQALFTHAIAVTQGNFAAHDYLASELALSGNPNDPPSMVRAIVLAGEHFRDAVDINPNDPVARYGLGRVLVQQGRYQEAADQLMRALALQPANADAHLELGFALANLEELDAAISEYKKAIQLRPSHPDVAEQLLGAAYLLRGDAEEAITHGRIALQINSGAANGHLLLGQALATLGRLSEAVGELEKAQAQRPNDPAIRGLISKVREEEQGRKKGL